MFINSFQEEIWRSKYQYKDESFEEFCRRISDNIFPNDKNLSEKLFGYLQDGVIVFGGRINSNIGIPENGLTLFNCFIESVGKNPDSLEGIMDMVTRYVTTLKTEGGVGFCANYLRPANTLIRKIGVTTPGSIKFLELFDKASEIITAGNVNGSTSYQGMPSKKSIRKGATMVTMSISHPDIESFITAKSVPNRLTKMNMSVLVSDAFMYAVENDMDWDLWFPDINSEYYETEWFGDMEDWASKGYPTVVYKTVRARALWDLLLQNTYTRNEPGILFIDNVRRYDNLFYLPNCSITSTNPCVASGTLVATSRGLIPVEEISEDDTIQTTLGFGKADKIKVYENCPLYRVHFSDGFYQDVTEGHIFHTMLNHSEARKTWNNNKRLKDVDVGEFVRKECYKFMPDFDTTLTRDDGLIIGLYLGDGCFSNDNCFNISVDSRENNTFISDLFKRVGGSYRIDDSEGNCCRYYLTGVNDYIKSLFNKFGIDSSTKEFDLCKLLNTNKEFILGMIDGLISSDGNVNMKGRYAQIRFKNNSVLIHTLLKHLMLFVKAEYKIYLSGKKGEVSTIYGREVIRTSDCFEGIIENDSILNFYNEVQYLSHPLKNKYLREIIKTKQLNGVKWKTHIKSIEYIGDGKAFDIYNAEADDWNHEGYVSRGCGEVPGSTGWVVFEDKVIYIGDDCDLGSLNLVKFYDPKTERFNLAMFKDALEILVRALDAVIDISKYPLDEYSQGAKLKRKIGVGLMGVGSLMMMMNIRYGSEPCIKFLNNLLLGFMNKLYGVSAILAKEKGSFPLYNEEIFNGGYVANSGVLEESTLDMIKKYGLRNSALSAIAPNGTGSILAGNVSGGLEPVFATEIVRWNRVEGTENTFDYPDIHKGEWYETDYFKEESVFGDVMLMSTDGKYRVDKNNGLCKKVIIKDYGYVIAEEKRYENIACATDLSIEEHLNVLSIFAKYVDQSCSKTINLPHDISFEDFKDLYGRLHKFGIKGCTTYREGTMVGVLETIKKEEKRTIKEQQQAFLDVFKDHGSDIIFDQVSLPAEYPSRGHILRSDGGRKWYVHLAFKDIHMTKIFAIFVNTNSPESSIVVESALNALIDLARSFNLNGNFLADVKRKYANQKNPVKICRMLGFLLRHNVPLTSIVQVLDGVKDATVGTFVFNIKKLLSKYITASSVCKLCPECGENSLVFSEGCFMCGLCGYSRCG